MSNTTAGSQADPSQSIEFIIMKGTSDGMFMRTGGFFKQRPVSSFLIYVTLKSHQGEGEEALLKSREEECCDHLKKPTQGLLLIETAFSFSLCQSFLMLT